MQHNKIFFNKLTAPEKTSILYLSLLITSVRITKIPGLKYEISPSDQVPGQTSGRAENGNLCRIYDFYDCCIEKSERNA